MDLQWTSQLMSSTDYRQRFFAEYWQLKLRYEGLNAYLNKIEAARLMNTTEPPHEVPEKYLKEQLKCMHQYLHILEVRAIIENIDLAITQLNFERVDAE